MGKRTGYRGKKDGVYGEKGRWSGGKWTVVLWISDWSHSDCFVGKRAEVVGRMTALGVWAPRCGPRGPEVLRGLNHDGI